MTRQYHILVGRQTGETKFEMIFGDYEKSVVEDEKEDTNTDDYKALKVITLKEDNQAAIDAKMAELNKA